MKSINSILRVIVLASALLTITALKTDAADLVSYQAPGWRYKQIHPSDPIANEFFSVGFDDSGWATGNGAFGSMWAGCDVHVTIQTQWDLSTHMLLRRSFHADPLVPVVIHYSIDNDANIWVNGVLVASVGHEYCPVLDEFSVVVPPQLIELGVNEIAVQAMDRGGFAYFDARIEGDAPTPTHSASWGRLKIAYR